MKRDEQAKTATLAYLYQSHRQHTQHQCQKQRIALFVPGQQTGCKGRSMHEGDYRVHLHVSYRVPYRIVRSCPNPC